MGSPYRVVAIVQALLSAALLAAIVSRILLFPGAVPEGPGAPLVAASVLAAVAWGVLAFWNTRYLLRGTGRRAAIWIWGVMALFFPIGTVMAILPLWVLIRDPEPDATATKA